MYIINNNVTAQTAISFEDHFNSLHRRWWGNGLSRVANGQLIIDGTLVTSYIYREVFLDPGLPFKIQASIRKVSGGGPHAGYGLYFVHGDDEDDFPGTYFLVYPSSNRVTVETNTAGNKILQVRNEKKITNLNNTDWQQLEISSDTRNLNFAINGQSIYSIPLPKYSQSQVGFIAMQGMIAAADKITIFQNQPKINLAPALETVSGKENLGPGVNSTAHEMQPVVSADGKTLYFMRRWHGQNTGGSLDSGDIWYARMQPDGKFGIASNIGRPLNNRNANAVVSVSPDNNTLIVEREYNPDGSFKARGLSISERTADGSWTVPKALKIKNYYNRNRYDTYFLCADKKTIVMAVERDDSYGSLDFYVSFLQPDGTWSEPKNMGNQVNTFGSEGGQYIAPDNKTMYFATNGRPGYGGMDLYITRRLDDSWTKWSEPQNLGPAINSEDWEQAFTVPASGDYAYITSYNGSYGNTSDIFRLKLPESLKPNPTVIVYGKVLNSKTKQPIGTGINYSDLISNKELGVAQSSPSDGSYKIALAAGKRYSFMANKTGFIAVEENIDLTNITAAGEVQRDLLLTPIEVGANVRMNNIFFTPREATLLPESYAELDRLAEFLQNNPSIRIEISGHTDNPNKPEYSLRLSEARANAVFEYLVSKGIDKNRMQPKGYGGSKPLAPNDTPENMAKNRRVEFTILNQ